MWIASKIDLAKSLDSLTNTNLLYPGQNIVSLFQGRILGGALGAWAPRGHQRGAKKKEKGKGKERERGEK